MVSVAQGPVLTDSHLKNEYESDPCAFLALVLLSNHVVNRDLPALMIISIVHEILTAMGRARVYRSFAAGVVRRVPGRPRHAQALGPHEKGYRQDFDAIATLVAGEAAAVARMPRPTSRPTRCAPRSRSTPKPMRLRRFSGAGRPGTCCAPSCSPRCSSRPTRCRWSGSPSSPRHY